MELSLSVAISKCLLMRIGVVWFQAKRWKLGFQMIEICGDPITKDDEIQKQPRHVDCLLACLGTLTCLSLTELVFELPSVKLFTFNAMRAFVKATARLLQRNRTIPTMLVRNVSISCRGKPHSMQNMNYSNVSGQAYRSVLMNFFNIPMAGSWWTRNINS